MHTLVTGGAGFIGSNIVSTLLAEGHSVTVIDDFSSGYRCNLDDAGGADLIEADICDPVALTAAAQSTEVIFHLAASVGNQRSINDPVRDAEVNVIGTIRVLEAARRAGVRRVVMSSSAGIFGELKTLPIREDHVAEPDSPYGASKLGAEKEGLAYAKLFGLEVVCLRYFNVYGPRQRFDAYGNVIPIFVFQMLRGQPVTIYGDGEQTRDFVSVRDVVQANIKAATAPRATGAFNIGSGTRISINVLVDQLKAATGLTPDIRYGAPRAGDVRDSLADIDAARKAFGFEPRVAIDSGLEEYVTWARTEVAP
jgi:UDP-glucose 4-epimerase